MNQVLKCDRCGAIYEPDYSNIQIFEHRRTNGAYLNTYDLCDQCKDEFHKFMSKKEEPKKVEPVDPDVEASKSLAVYILEKRCPKIQYDLQDNTRVVFMRPSDPLTENEKKIITKAFDEEYHCGAIFVLDEESPL